MKLLNLIHTAEYYLAHGKTDMAHNCILKLIHDDVIGDLFKTLQNLVYQVEEDCPLDYRTRHLDDAIDDACEVLKYLEMDQETLTFGDNK